MEDKYDLVLGWCRSHSPNVEWLEFRGINRIDYKLGEGDVIIVDLFRHGNHSLHHLMSGGNFLFYTSFRDEASLVEAFEKLRKHLRKHLKERIERYNAF